MWFKALLGPKKMLPAILIFWLMLLNVSDHAVSAPLSSTGTYTLLVSTSSGRSNPVALDGITVSGNIYVFSGPDAGVVRVHFYLDDPNMTGKPRQTESNAPYDFAGGTVSTANPFKTTTVANGSHTITAAVELTNGTTEVVYATFVVNN